MMEWNKTRDFFNVWNKTVCAETLRSRATVTAKHKGKYTPANKLETNGSKAVVLRSELYAKLIYEYIL